MNAERNEYKPLSILLIEDDDIDAMGIERALRKKRIVNSLHRARDGLEALDMLRDELLVQRPYIILLDINMPRMNGLEFLEEIRSDPKLTKSIVFVLTTSSDDQDRVSAYQYHVAGYVLKKNMGEGFQELITMLDHFWRLVELPK